MNVQEGNGICIVCAGKDSNAAWEAFKVRVTELGGQVVEPQWLGKDAPYRLICGKGHEVTTRPGHVREGRGVCRVCAGRNPATAWANFKDRIAKSGGRVLEPKWLGSRRPHRAISAVGHHCMPWPSSVQQGRYFCLACTLDKSSPDYIAWRAARAADPPLALRPQTTTM